MRTDEEILTRIEVAKADDPFGFEITDLVYRLPFEAAKKYLKPEAKAEEWATLGRDRETLLNEMRNYAEFAWGKALGHRGISASRSVSHYQAWTWLLGDEDYNAIDWEKYQNYGAPVLKQICDRFGFPIPEGSEAKNMAEGLSCCVGCESGCGQ